MGALTSKLYSFQARPWEFKKEKGIDIYEGKDIIFELRGLEVLRVLPQEGWISDKIRIVMDGFKSNRLYFSKKFSYQTGVFTEVSLFFLGRIFSLLFPRDNSLINKEKRNFFFPLFFSGWRDTSTSTSRRFEKKEKKKWNYITS